MAATDLADLADSILAAVEARHADAGIGLPNRRYTHTGEVAYDCEQLVVTLTGVFAGLPASPHNDPVNPVAPISASFEIHVVRCVPTLDQQGNPPSVDRLNASAQEIATDHYVLARGILTSARTGEYGDHCQAVTIDRVGPADPQGGYGGTIATISVGIV